MLSMTFLEHGVLLVTMFSKLYIEDILHLLCSLAFPSPGNAWAFAPSVQSVHPLFICSSCALHTPLGPVVTFDLGSSCSFLQTGLYLFLI